MKLANKYVSFNTFERLSTPLEILLGSPTTSKNDSSPINDEPGLKLKVR